MSDVKTASQMTLDELYFAMVNKCEALEHSFAEAKEENVKLQILLDKANKSKPKFDTSAILAVDWGNAPAGAVKLAVKNTLHNFEDCPQFWMNECGRIWLNGVWANPSFFNLSNYIYLYPRDTVWI